MPSHGILSEFDAVTGALRYTPAPGFNGTDQFTFTVDDGKTVFPVDATLLPPFPHGGKTAYRAYVYTCDNGETQWVGYLERYTDSGKAMLRAMRDEQLANPAAMPPVNAQLPDHTAVKRPGAGTWVKQSDNARAVSILDIRCPHGGQHDPEPALP